MCARFLIASLCLLACPAFSADTLVACGVLDPEVHDGLGMIVYQHVVLDANNDPIEQQAKVQWINGDGSLYDSSDDGVIATDVNDYLASQAGPKIGNGGNGTVPATYIVYSRLTPNNNNVNVPNIGLIRYNSAATDCHYPTMANEHSPQPCLTDSESIPGDNILTNLRIIAYTTEDEEYDRPATVVYHYQGAMSTHQLRWSSIAPWFQSSGAETGITGEAGQWGRLHRYRLGTSVELRIATVQDEKVKLIRLSNQAVTDVTPDGDWFNPFLFQDETGRNMMVMRKDNSGSSDIVVYAETTTPGQWEHFETITAADLIDPDTSDDESDRPFLLSPEAFIWEQHAYLLFSSASTSNALTANDGNIWLVRVNGFDTHQTRVNTRSQSNNGKRNRVEGEIYLGGDDPTIYYSQLWKPYDPQLANGGCDQTEAIPDVSQYALRAVTLQQLP